MRRVRLEYPDDLDPVWTGRLPEVAYAANGVSLLMPHVEPFVVRSVRGVIADLPDGLRERAEVYARQETGHHVQHRRFNALISSRYPALRHVERMMGWTYDRMSRRAGRRFGLAYAAAFESVAFASARWTDRHLHRFFGDADPAAATLFLWHLAEEVEHKSVAIDVYDAIDGSRLRYALGLIRSMLHLGVFTLASTAVIMAGERRLLSPVAWFRLSRWALSFLFEAVPTIIVSALPGHHPDQLADPAWFARWLGDHDPATGTIPAWR